MAQELGALYGAVLDEAVGVANRSLQSQVKTNITALQAVDAEEKTLPAGDPISATDRAAKLLEKGFIPRLQVGEKTSITAAMSVGSHTTQEIGATVGVNVSVVSITGTLKQDKDVTASTNLTVSTELVAVSFQDLVDETVAAMTPARLPVTPVANH